MTTYDEAIWYPEPSEEGQELTVPDVIINSRQGNGFHLDTVIRKYTGATLTFIRRNSVKTPVVKIEVSKLYDALGLLRSLQHDVTQFNHATSTMPSAESKYATFRLSKQAAAFGVRLPRIGEGPIEVPGLDSLVAYIEDKHNDVIEAARSNIAAGIVDFDSLQEYFQPGGYFVDNGVGTGVTVPTLMRARACYYSRRKAIFGIVSSFYVAMEVVVAIGDRKYAVVEAQFLQSQFNGTRSLTQSMDMFTSPSPELLKMLTTRGMQYQAICSPDTSMPNALSGSGVMVEYNAGTFIPTGRGSLKGSSSRQGSYGQASRSGGRMIVDTSASWSRGVHCAQNTGMASDVVVSSLKLYAQTRSQHSVQQTADTYNTSSQVNPDADNHNELLILSGPLPDCLVAMTWPTVPGFSLQARTWGVVMVQGTKNVEFNEKAYDALVMSESRKKLIRALVTSHDGKESIDVIAGKGEGSIFLLHGPPGVGKTLTAEAIAEMLHKPLYVVSMGELGTSPESLEERLQDILDLCIPWKALVLIDEAEMLLERRTKNDIVRNAMVCVMLRLLEYYSGILFLTTNRVESLDPAFQSRVTCALRYDPLSFESRKEIWSTMMNRLNVHMPSAVVDDLAKVDINGRQIKNTLQLALALARHEGIPVSPKHLRETLDVTTSFLNDSPPGNDKFN
jgi:hypothetical protein